MRRCAVDLHVSKNDKSLEWHHARGTASRAEPPLEHGRYFEAQARLGRCCALKPSRNEYPGMRIEDGSGHGRAGRPACRCQPNPSIAPLSLAPENGLHRDRGRAWIVTSSVALRTFEWVNGPAPYHLRRKRPFAKHAPSVVGPCPRRRPTQKRQRKNSDLNQTVHPAANQTSKRRRRIRHDTRQFCTGSPPAWQAV